MTIRNSVERTVDQFRHAASAVESAGRVGRRTYENLHSPPPVMAAASGAEAAVLSGRLAALAIASGRYGRFSTASYRPAPSVVVPA
jgi:hypothetical protein